MSLLSIKKLSKSFGGLIAVNNLSLDIQPGELVGLIGPNGAGKTTVFNILTGVYPPSSGEIWFQEHSLVGLKPYQITQKGIARTFQNIRLFDNLTVLDNVRIALHSHSAYRVTSSFIRSASFKKGENFMRRKAMEILKIFKLDDKYDEIARNLPYGEQRRLEISRALAAQPRLLLLDEPAAGMNPQETQELMELIRWVRNAFSLTVLLIEHDMSLVMGVCERIYVLDYGMLIAQGNPQEIKSHPRVIEAYLGEEVATVAEDQQH